MWALPLLFLCPPVEPGASSLMKEASRTASSEEGYAGVVPAAILKGAGILEIK